MGLLRTTARAAVAANVATRVHHRTAAWQQAQWQQMTAAPPHPAPTPAPVAGPAAGPVAAPPAGSPSAAPAAASSDTAALLAQLGELGRLRDAGVLTNAEFELQKARLLGT
ncbi:MAG TPA: SHOCT domain-containing protein [Mycobacteriales bacterium]|nr:SHOCT domain-containing protein [Mycobacteriales bacterium]